MYYICPKCKQFSTKKYNELLDPEYENNFCRIRYSKDYVKVYEVFCKFLTHMIGEISKNISGLEKEKEFCTKCTHCKSEFLSDSKIVYIKSLNVTKIFDSLIKYDFLTIMNKAKNVKSKYKFFRMVRIKLLEFRGKDAPVNEEWQGFDYYYIRIFNYSKILEDIIPVKNMKLISPLREEIYSHPLAFYGLRYESWQKIVELIE